MRSELRIEMSKAIRQRIQVLLASGNMERNSVPLVDKKPTFEVDLRVEGVLQDAILEDEELMKETNKKLEKLKIGSCTKSIRNDLKKKVIRSSVKTQVAFFCEMGNVELIEQRQTSATIQCPSCLDTRTRGIEHVSMRRLASIQSRYDNMDHSQI